MERRGDYSPATARGIDTPRDSPAPDLAPLPAATPIGPTWSSVNLQQKQCTHLETKLGHILTFVSNKQNIFQNPTQKN
jgi:hypothetical protein